MKTFISDSLESTQEFASEWLNSIFNIQNSNIEVRISNIKNEAMVMGLSGHLGAGKTAFVKQVAKILEIKEEVTSPTFVIMKIYPVHGQGDIHRLVHIDLYRLERPEELQALNFESVVSDPHNLVMIEWPENVGLKDFAKNCHLKFAIVDGRHTISVE